MSESKKAYLLCPFGNDSGLYREWPEQLSVSCELVDNYRSDWECPEDAAILISHMHYRWEECNILRRTLDGKKVPVLILADGLIEYRNTFDNPTIADGSVFQPVFGHKIACLGKAQVRILESWGNAGKCELVGLPRFDRYILSEPEIRSDNVRAKQFRVLITTASTPYFDDQQKARTIQSLKDLKLWFETNVEFCGRNVRPIWRLSEELDPLLEVHSQESENLFDVLNSVDALLTTPSTLALEGALKRKPVAILDYHNQPAFMPPSWQINHASQIESVLTELISPPASKMLFQDMTLHDQLECRSPASPRMVSLVESMISMQNSSENSNFGFPLRILNEPDCGFQAVEDSFQLEELFPNNKTFATEDVLRLQTELSRAILRLGQLPDELLENREYNRYLAKRLNEVRDRLKRRNARVWDLRQEVILLEKRIAELMSTVPVDERP